MNTRQDVQDFLAQKTLAAGGRQIVGCDVVELAPLLGGMAVWWRLLRAPLVQPGWSMRSGG